MVTLADVAKHAGVSSSTVSYVLSGKRTISEETRRRVEQAVAELGYHPNARARALAARRSYIIALVVPLRPESHDPTTMEIATSVTIAARQYGYDVLLITNDEGPEGVRRVASSGLADGVILMDVEPDDQRIPVLRELGTQAALIGLPDEPGGLSSVDHDFAAAGGLCADHLADLGHREVAFISHPRHTAHALGGFRDRARRRGLRFVHRASEGTYGGVAGTFARILADRPDTTAFVVQNEGAIGPLLTLLRGSGRTVPEDASVIAVGPGRLADQHTPRLTVVSGPDQELGRVAVEQLLRRLTAAARGEQPVDEQVLLTPVLTVGESTGPKGWDGKS
ncbi:LacI family DNA-binding transcriptional regulator [Saccharothrix variisporea]|uniref:DNA-binding LacI/PurR family transcriptional regulator n=1 Tax=Saccharothrix variisporea TaxID=543527 RepID=A0A495X2S1_9PSEU|nr:LacI family DNA-binding transcriptional regulator [Saccharothrix variisporea]RKT67839.1 DNA-binding LacI/PurR family transcriptional regulator [Saccharothrix variisporea]